MKSDADIKEDYCRQMFKHLDDNLRTDLKRRFTSSEIWEILNVISEWQIEQYKVHLVELARVVNWPHAFVKTENSATPSEQVAEFLKELEKI